jgi:hypothetical protein
MYVYVSVKMQGMSSTFVFLETGNREMRFCA